MGNKLIKNVTCNIHGASNFDILETIVIPIYTKKHFFHIKVVNKKKKQLDLVS